jgi:hypothetical protein
MEIDKCKDYNYKCKDYNYKCDDCPYYDQHHLKICLIKHLGDEQ